MITTDQVFDGDIGGLGVRVETVCRVITLWTRSIGVVALEHGKFVEIFEVIESRHLVATVASIVDKRIRPIIPCINTN